MEIFAQGNIVKQGDVVITKHRGGEIDIATAYGEVYSLEPKGANYEVTGNFDVGKVGTITGEKLKGTLNEIVETGSTDTLTEVMTSILK